MKVIISGRHIDITKALRDFIDKKAAKIEEFFPGVRQVKVILEVQKYRHTAEIVFQAGPKIVAAKKTTKDMYASLEEVLHTVERQATKLKEKTRSPSARRHRGEKDKRFIEIKDEAPLSEPKARKKAPVRSAAPGLKIGRIRLNVTTPMSVEDAVAKMQASGKDLYSFVNAKTGATSVLVRRKNDIGLIE